MCCHISKCKEQFLLTNWQQVNEDLNLACQSNRLDDLQVHRRLGLDRAAHPSQGGLYSGASPLSLQTFQYFLSLDLPIMELLGSSETCGPQAGETVGYLAFIFYNFPPLQYLNMKEALEAL